MAFNPNDDEPVWDLVDFSSRGNEVILHTYYLFGQTAQSIY